jgi:hypothetical protein
MTKDTEEASPTVTRRYVLMGGAALAVVAAPAVTNISR